MTDTNIYTENAIRTFTGLAFDLKIMDPESICIEDIAHALSHVSRFGGHLDQHYSVAQHSVYVAQCLSPKNQLAGLLHDATEAYMGDMPSPFKKMMPEFKILEDKLMAVISEKFGFQFPFDPEIKHYDAVLLDREWNSFVLKNEPMDYWSPEFAKEVFLEMFEKITNQPPIK